MPKTPKGYTLKELETLTREDIDEEPNPETLETQYRVLANIMIDIYIEWKSKQTPVIEKPIQNQEFGKE